MPPSKERTVAPPGEPTRLYVRARVARCTALAVGFEDDVGILKFVSFVVSLFLGLSISRVVVSSYIQK